MCNALSSTLIANKIISAIACCFISIILFPCILFSQKKSNFLSDLKHEGKNLLHEQSVKFVASKISRELNLDTKLMPSRRNRELKGEVLQRANKAKEVFARSENIKAITLGDNFPQVQALPDGSIVILPNQKVTLDLMGFCLDKGLPAPHSGERAPLVTVDEYFGSPEITEIYTQILKYSFQNPGSSTTVQSLLWRIAHRNDFNRTQSKLTSKEKTFLDKAIQGGAATFEAKVFNSGQVYVEKIMALFSSGFIKKKTKGFSQDVLQELWRRHFAPQGIDQNFYTRDDYSEIEIDQLLNSLSGLQVQGNSQENSEFTLLADNVAARAASVSGVHGMRVQVANLSDKPYTYVPYNHIGLPTRQTQPIANYPVYPPGYSGKNPGYPNPPPNSPGDNPDEPIDERLVDELVEAFEIIIANAELIEWQDILVGVGLTAATVFIAPEGIVLFTLARTGIISRVAITNFLRSAAPKTLGYIEGLLVKFKLFREGINLSKNFYKSATKIYGNGLTEVGRALQKHASRKGSAFEDIKFSYKTANQDGLKILKEIVNSKNKVIKEMDNGTKHIYDKSTGRGFGITRNGLFNGFRNLEK